MEKVDTNHVFSRTMIRLRDVLDVARGDLEANTKPLNNLLEELEASNTMMYKCQYYCLTIFNWKKKLFKQAYSLY